MGFSLGTAEGRIVVDGSAAAAGFKVAEAAAQSMYGIIEGKLDKVQKLGTDLLKIGTVGAAGFGLAVNTAANFEQRMSAVQAVSGATAEEFDALREKALQLGKDTAYGATDAASAIEELVKAGLSIPDVMNGAADATVNLAAAGEIALPQAAEIAANAMNNFNLAGEDMPRIADLIAGAANASAISVSEFGQSMSQVGAVANLTGMSFDDISVAIAEMGNAGIKGSDAGTSLKTMLMNLQPATKEQTKEFERLGLLTTSTEGALKSMAEQGIKPVGTSMDEIRQAVGAYLVQTQGLEEDTKALGEATDKWLMQNGGVQNAFFTTEGKVKSLSEIQQVLADTTGDMTEQQKLASLEILFGADAIRAAAVMAKEGSAGYDELLASMEKVTAADVAATRMNNFKGVLEQLKGAIETVAIEIGSVLLPPLTWLGQKLDGVISSFLNLPEPVKKAIYILAAVATALSLLVGGLITAAFAIAPLIASFLGMLALKSVVGIFTAIFGAMISGAGPSAALAAAVGKIMIIFGRLRTVVTVATVALRLMGAAWAIATGPIGIAIAAVAALAAAFAYLYNNNAGFKAFVDGLVSSIRDGLQPVLEGAKAAVQAFMDGFNGLGAGVDGGALMTFFAVVGQGAALFWNTLMGLVDWFMGNLMPVLSEAGRTLQETLGNSFNQIKDVVLNQLWPALQSLGDSLMTALGPAIEWVSDNWQILAAILGGVVLAPILLVAGAIVALVAVLATILPPIIAFGAGIVNTIVNVVTPVIQGLIGIFTGVFGVIQGLVNVFIGLFTGNWSRMGEGLMQIVNGIWTVIVSLFTGLWGAVSAAVSGFVDSVIAFFTTLWDVLVGHSIVPDMINAIVEWFLGLPGRVLGTIAGFVADIIGHFAGFAIRVVADIAKFANDVWNFFKTLAINVLVTVVKFVADVVAKYIELATQVLQKVSKLITDVVNFFTGLPAKVIAAVATLAGQLLAAGGEWIAGAVNGVNNAVGGLISIFSGLGGKIKSALGATGSLLYSAGKGIIQGLLDGINNVIGKVKSTLTTLTSNIPKWKGPPKTDAKLLIAAGRMIMQGLNKGIQIETPALKKQLKSLMPLMQQQISLEGNYRPRETRITVEAPVDSNRSGGATYNFNAYGTDAREASDKAVRKVRAMVAMGAF